MEGEDVRVEQAPAPSDAKPLLLFVVYTHSIFRMHSLFYDCLCMFTAADLTFVKRVAA